MKRIILAAGIGAASLALAACAEPPADDGTAADEQSIAEDGLPQDSGTAEGDVGDQAGDALESMDDGDKGNDGGRQAGT